MTIYSSISITLWVRNFLGAERRRKRLKYDLTVEIFLSILVLLTYFSCSHELSSPMFRTDESTILKFIKIYSAVS